MMTVDPELLRQAGLEQDWSIWNVRSGRFLLIAGWLAALAGVFSAIGLSTGFYANYSFAKRAEKIVAELNIEKS